MRSKTLPYLGVLALLAAVSAPAARAEQNVPGSVLVFPYVDTGRTVISITNNYLEQWEGPQAGILPNGNVQCVPGDPQSDHVGDTAVHLLFFRLSADEDLNCTHDDRFIPLMTPQDHATFLLTDLGIEPGVIGWLVAFAVVPNSDDPEGNPIPWAFDFLSGQAWNVVTGDNFTWSYNAYPFLSLFWADIPSERTPCDRERLDYDEFLDFDGDEYEKWGDKLLLPRLFEEANDGAEKDSILALISPLSTIEDWRNHKVTFSTLFWNNDENTHGSPFSRTTVFRCMFVGSLRSVSRQFENLGGTAPPPEQDTGWAIFNGYSFVNESGYPITNDPPLLGVFAQLNVPDDRRFDSGANFFTRGFNYYDAKIQYLFGVEEPPPH